MRPHFRRVALGLAIALVVAGRCVGQGTVTSGYLEVDTVRGPIVPVAADAGSGLAGAAPMVVQAATGQYCPNCLPPVTAPPSPYGPHPLFPLFRQRTSPYAPSMPAPPVVPPSVTPKEDTTKKEPPKDTTPSTETPTTPDFAPSPAAGTETGQSSYAFDNMFGSPFGGGGARISLPGIARPGALSGPGGLITFSNTSFGSPSQFALIPVTVSNHGLTGTIQNVGQLPLVVNGATANAYNTRLFAATPGQAGLFLAAVSPPLIQPTIRQVSTHSPQTVALLVGQPSPVFYAAQNAQPGSLLTQFTITNGALLAPSFGKNATFAGTFNTVVLVPFAPATTVNVPDPAAGGVVGRYRPSEDTNPLPRDRFIFNYDYFSDVPLGVGSDVNRINIGFEKTFFNGMTSVEVRLPIAATVASDMVLGNQITRAEIGDLRITPRLLLYNTPTVHVGTGMSMYLPTQDSVRIAADNGTPLVRIPNSAFVVSPYLGVLYTPNNRLFAQAWASCDFDTNGDPVYINPGGTNLAYAGRLQDPANLGLDAQFGYWVYKTPPNRVLTGIAPFAEIHYTSNLAPRNAVTEGIIAIPSQTLNQLNLTAGLYTLFGARSAIQFGAVIPLRTTNQPFGVQFGVHANFFFGPNIGPPTFVSSF